jgi:nitrate reductase assembly molybdenum cofactor insertion protein NarJ
VAHRIQYELLAPLFEYPQADFPEQAANIKDYLDGRYADAATELGHFADLLPVDDLEAMQELFTRSFDVQAATTLDVGYVLFGDDYKRGILLANLNREHRTANIDTGTELGDYIPNLLRLMAVMEDEEVLHDLAYAILGPALLEMIGEFSTERIEKRNKKYEKHYKTLIEVPAVATEAVTLYQFALKSLYAVLKQDFTLIETMPLERSNDFLESVSRENQIEETAAAQSTA